MPIQDEDILEEEMEDIGDEPVLEEEDVEEDFGEKDEIVVAVEEAIEQAGPEASRREKIDLAIAELQSMVDEPVEEEEEALGGLGTEEEEGLPLDDMEPLA